MEDTTTTSDTTGQVNADTGALTDTAQQQPAASGSDAALNGEPKATTAQPTQTAQPVKPNDAALTGDQPKEEAIDWEKITDDEYLSKVKLPEGQKWNKDVIGEFAKILKENKIDPKVFEKVVNKDIEIQKAQSDKRNADKAKADAEHVKAFQEAGRTFRKTFSPEQMREMNATLSQIDDAEFKKMVTKTDLANNTTMGKMLLAYQQVYGEDKTVGAGGLPSNGEKSFVDVWTGRS